jgi:hypothetical protein
MKNQKTAQSEVAQWISDRALVTEDGCWLLLTGDSGPNGYKSMVVGGKNRRAHRAVHEAFVGPTEGKLVCHTCDVRACVNPSHLFLGTPKDNTRDMIAKGRARGGSSPGAANPSAKLTARQVATIRRLRAAGTPCHALASRFGVHRTTITCITGGQSWSG